MSQERSYKVSWILTQTKVISIRSLRMRMCHYEFILVPSYCPSQKLSNEHSYKFSWILTLTEVIRIRIFRMRIISAIMNFYWSHAIALQKLSNEHSYKFSWILTLLRRISTAIDIISREILHSSNLIGFTQFSAKKVENISTFFNFARNTTI